MESFIICVSVWTISAIRLSYLYLWSRNFRRYHHVWLIEGLKNNIPVDFQLFVMNNTRLWRSRVPTPTNSHGKLGRSIGKMTTLFLCSIVSQSLSYCKVLGEGARKFHFFEFFFPYLSVARLRCTVNANCLSHAIFLSRPESILTFLPSCYGGLGHIYKK